MTFGAQKLSPGKNQSLLASWHIQRRLRAAFTLCAILGAVVACGRQEISGNGNLDPARTKRPQEASQQEGAVEGEKKNPPLPTFAQVPPQGKHSWKPEWNLFLAEAIEDFGTDLLKNSFVPQDDINDLCPGFFNADKHEKIAFWALFFASFARYESGFNPAKRFEEDSSLNYEYSEGLLQLSYSDANNYTQCKFKKSAGNILDPKMNLQCGVAILKTQIAKRQALFTDDFFYWSVLTNKKEQIRKDFLKASEQLSFCGASATKP